MHPVRPLRLLLGLVLSAPAVIAAENILLNASFETTRLSGLPADWGLYLPEPADKNPLQLARASALDFTSDASVAREGARSLRIRSAVPVRAAAHQRELPCLPGQRWRFSAWMRGQGLAIGSGRGAAARLAFSSSTDPARHRAAFAQSVYLRSDASDFDWRRLETEVEVPAEADSMILELYLWQSAGTVWFDDVSVELVSGPSLPDGARADPANLARYREENRSLGAPTAGVRRVVFIGDSITQRWDLDAFFTGQGYINRGISGQHSSQILGRLHQDVLGLSPRVVFLMAGTNDLAGWIPPELIAANIREAVRLCAERGIRVVVGSVLPVSDYHAEKNPAYRRTADRPPALLRDLNQRLASLCAEEPNASFLDLYSLVVDGSDQMPAKFASDGLHPNAACYRVLAPAVADALTAALVTTR